MPQVRATGYPAAVVFDAFGTIFDFAGPVIRHAAVLGNKAEPLIATWREKQLQYTWLRSLADRYADFERVTADALDFALESLAIANPRLRGELLALYHELPVFPDARRALEELNALGVRALILSNGTGALLDANVRRAGIGHLVDALLSVDTVGIYKPSQRVYQMAVDAVGVHPGQIAFVSANGWDAYAGAAFGFRTIWCNRAASPRERLPGTVAHELRSLGDLLGSLESRV